MALCRSFARGRPCGTVGLSLARLPLALLGFGFRMATLMGRCALPAGMGQLLACCWLCRVWWAQLAATLYGAAAEEWQPLVPSADDYE